MGGSSTSAMAIAAATAPRKPVPSTRAKASDVERCIQEKHQMPELCRHEARAMLTSANAVISSPAAKSRLRSHERRMGRKLGPFVVGVVCSGVTN